MIFPTNFDVPETFYNQPSSVKKKLSIADIAEALGISKTSVSFILNGQAEEKRISKKLVDKVTSYVEQVGYKPNLLAKSLRTGKSNTIALMVEDISNPFFASIARLIEDRAYQHGYRITYCSTDNDTAKTKDMIDIFRDRHVDGYIIAPPEGIEEDISNLQKNDLPVVLFDRYLQNIATDVVVIDNKYSTYNATALLVKNGYKNIAFVTFDNEQVQMRDRKQGYLDCITENGLKPTVAEVNFSRNDDEITNPIFDFLSAHTELDAVVFGTNHVGTCGLKAIQKLGLKITDDLAVISFDDYDVFQLHSPPITAIAQPIEQIANQVITLLLNKLNGVTDIGNKQEIVVPTRLNVRGSSGAGR